MPIDTHWDNEHKTWLYVNIVLPWDWTEFRQAIAEAQPMLESKQDAHAIMVDVRDAGDIPPAGFLVQSRYALQNLPPLPMIFIANTDIMRMILAPLTKVLPTSRRFFFVRNLEKAHAIAASGNTFSERIG